MKPNQTDQTLNLLNHARKGDDVAVNELLDRHRKSLNHMVRMRLDKRISNRVDVSDVVQDVLVEANRRLERYLENPVMPFQLWLRQIAKDRIIDAHRRHRVSAKRSVDREIQIGMSPTDNQSSLHLASILIDNQKSPTEGVMEEELIRRVKQAIALLGESDAEIIRMRHFRHLSNQEISAELGLTEPAASMRYLRAIRKLRDLINESSLA